MNKSFTIILLIAVAVLVTLQVKSLFGEKEVDRKAIENEIRLEYLQKEYPQIVRQRDSISARYDSLIAASQERYQQLETRKQPIYNAIKQVPVIVNNLDKEQLRGAITTYYEKYK